ncbi:MAG: NusG domain II-containing protein [Anaerovoracaceae bacterium]
MLQLIKKADIVLILALIALGLWATIFFSGSGGAPKEAVITVDGKLYGSYDLLTPQTITLPCGNWVKIEDQGVFMSDATCGGRDCVRQGKITAPPSTIVCLPHKVIIELKGELHEYDTISK